MTLRFVLGSVSLSVRPSKLLFISNIVGGSACLPQSFERMEARYPTPGGFKSTEADPSATAGNARMVTSNGHGRTGMRSLFHFHTAWPIHTSELAEQKFEMPVRISHDDLIDDLWRLVDEFEKVPSAADVTDFGEYSINTYKRRFGSWNAAKEAAELPERGSLQDPEPYQEADVLRELYQDRGWTQQEIADHFDVGSSTIGNWLNRHEIEKPKPPWRSRENLVRLYWEEGKPIGEVAEELGTYRDVIHRAMVDLDVERRDSKREKDYPWQDEDTLRELYFEEGLNQRDIAEKFDTTQALISRWFRRFEIETPVGWQAANEGWRTKHPYFQLSKSGYEIAGSRVGDETHTVHVHKLVAIAEYGFDEVSGKVVHHINTIPWDNRPGNLLPMEDSEHKRLHRKNVNETITESGLTP